MSSNQYFATTPHRYASAIHLKTVAVIERLESMSLDSMVNEACTLRKRGHGSVISYSRKVFIPLTRLCRDSCAYCTFANRG
jgi:2-iminoacetate synthase ThiH